MRWQRNNEARGKRFHLDETNLAPFPIPMKQQKLNNALEGLFQSSLKCSCGSIGNTNMNFPWDWPFFTLHLQHYMNAYLNEKHILSECGNDKEGRKKKLVLNFGMFLCSRVLWSVILLFVQLQSYLFLYNSWLQGHLKPLSLVISLQNYKERT